ncbi:amino acid ABC transporter substrate-binding protein [Bradyrhizobium manausense]|uniref:amino acid ABC transporter substrate-binding protein n=1 Tax=Bradyrhizobium manausense TaxID=989370 RepID=UPI001BA503D2|nr:amino acid ABC transporter substrate-binding protein [Bradyrhizobium manausense]MBR0828572.1 amino acid ABC transporter substrate-binding protein [Bradyrhizobium manausense]
MLRRTFNALMVTAALLALGAEAANADETLKVGVSAPKTGPQTGGAAAVYWPNVQLWVHDVNEKGGIKVGSKLMKIDLVEYDDKSSPEEAVKNIQRLATVDRVDFIISPYTTGINLATAPLISRYGYPQLVATGNANELKTFIKQWPNSFWLLGKASDLSTGIVGTLKTLRDKGQIGNKVALTYVAEAFGLEMIDSAKPAFKEAGFDIVYETSYPLGTQDLAPVISGAKAAKPDAFVAYSYPPDSFALTEQAQIQGLDVRAFYVGVGGALTGYGQRFEKQTEGILSMGGINPDDPAYKAYRVRHKQLTGQDTDYWAGAVVYSSLEILAQAIEKGGKDRASVVKAIQSGTFDTVIGKVSFDDNILRKVWTVGQWKSGEFHGVNGLNVDGAKDPVRKPAWN